MKTISVRFLPFILFLFLLSACTGWEVTVPTQDQAAIDQSVAETVSALSTQSSVNTVIAELTRISQFTATPLPPTETAVPTATFTATYTATATVTNTPVPTATPVPPTATATAQPIPCDLVGSIVDISIPDGTTFAPNKSFVKTWRLKNTGSCTWTTGYALVFVGGSALGAPTVVGLSTNVRPGDVVDVSVSMVSPAAAGTYTGYWQLRNAGGGLFGWGAGAKNSFWVKIGVINATATINPAKPLDFAANYCAAQWSSSTGGLPCPGTGNDYVNGSVTYTTAPKLEGGYQEDEPSIITIPSNGAGGNITGKFPAIAIQSGDRFTALVGCLDKRPNCNVMVQVNYSADGGPITNLGSWTEVYDGSYTNINVSLDSLAGKSVVFYLIVQNNSSSSDDQVFWTAPGIQR